VDRSPERYGRVGVAKRCKEKDPAHGANIQITITRMEAAFKEEIGDIREPFSGFQQEHRME
jgi:hypothetical protein